MRYLVILFLAIIPRFICAASSATTQKVIQTPGFISPEERVLDIYNSRVYLTDKFKPKSHKQSKLYFTSAGKLLNEVNIFPGKCDKGIFKISENKTTLEVVRYISSGSEIADSIFYDYSGKQLAKAIGNRVWFYSPAQKKLLGIGLEDGTYACGDVSDEKTAIKKYSNQALKRSTKIEDDYDFEYGTFMATPSSNENHVLVTRNFSESKYRRELALIDFEGNILCKKGWKDYEYDTCVVLDDQKVFIVKVSGNDKQRLDEKRFPGNKKYVCFDYGGVVKWELDALRYPINIKNIKNGVATVKDEAVSDADVWKKLDLKTGDFSIEK